MGFFQCGKQGVCLFYFLYCLNCVNASLKTYQNRNRIENFFMQSKAVIQFKLEQNVNLNPNIELKTVFNGILLYDEKLSLKISYPTREW